MKVMMIDRERIEFFCHGCNEKHIIDVKPSTWNHSAEAPTVYPIVRFNENCVVQISNGYATYAVESKHSLSGQTCLLSEII